MVIIFNTDINEILFKCTELYIKNIKINKYFFPPGFEPGNPIITQGCTI